MNMKKLACLLLALLLALGTCALAEDGDLQAQLDAANETIAELQALIDLYKPVYDSQVVAQYGENGVILKDVAQQEYDSAAAMYSQYGISIDAYASQIKQSILESLVQSAILDDKAEELGLTELSDETIAQLTEEAQSTFDSYVDGYKSYFSTDASGNELSDEEAIAETTAYLQENGLTIDSLVESLKSNYISEQLYSAVTADVEVTDEDVQAAYEALVESNKASYESDDRSYNSDRTTGETIAWNPEGYRAVKHVLVMFSDEQATRYNDLMGVIDDLNDELEALQNPEPEEESTEAEEAESSEDDTDADYEADEEEVELSAEEEEALEALISETDEEDVEAPAAPRTIEEVQTDLGVAGEELEALYSELMPKAQEVIDAFNAGTDFDALIAEYGEDPGMTQEPTATIGYAVSESSTYWESAFTEGAMSIAEVGQISAPVYGSNGIHIIYYMSDIPAGDVPLEEIEDAVREQALDDKVSETYNAQVSAWVEEAAPQYFLENF